MRLTNLPYLVGALTLCGGLVLPAHAQYPETECEPLVPAPAPDDPSVLTYCTDNPSADCDLEIANWDTTTTHRSPDLRIGDPFQLVGPTPAEQPRVFLDPGNPALTSDDRFYTKLYVKFRNAGGGPGGGGYAAAGAVSVDFSYKEVADAAAAEVAAADASGWTDAGTVTMPGPPPTIDNTYVMDIASPGVLTPSSYHLQQRGVCWTLDAGDPNFPKRFVLRAHVNWPDDEDTGNNTAFSYYDLTAEGNRARIAFAFDLSGSMSSTFEATTRLIAAQEKASLFTSLIENDDQLGVFGFATDNPSNSSFTTTYNTPPTPPTAFGDTSVIATLQTLTGDFQRGVIAGQISAQTAHNCTPVGQGLLRARAALQSPIPAPPAGTPAQAIVLFSDGLQNVPPFVNVTNPYPCAGGVAAPVINPMQTFTNDGIQIYSVYFGPEMGWAYNLMNDLKDQTGGDYIYGTANELQLAAAYFSIRGVLDDMVFFRESGTVVADPTPQPAVFEVPFDAAAGVATAAVTWPYGNGETRLTLERRRKGDSQWLPCQPPPGQVDTGAAAFQPKTYVVCRFSPGADSTWELRVRQVAPRRGSTEYSAAVFSPVQTAELHPTLDDQGFSTGDALTIHAELRTAGQPLTGATVNAQVRVPSRPFSTTLQSYSNRLTAAPSNPDSGRVIAIASQLSKLLAQDGQDDALYLYGSVPVPLRDDGQGADSVAGDGNYTGVLPGSETHVAGDYQVTITATATLSGGREVQRTVRLATICNVGPADPQATKVRTELLPDPINGARIVRVTVVPYDRFGNAAFPGSGARLSFTTRDATPMGDLVDNLDASFSRDFRIDRDGATVSVKVDDDVVAKDRPLLPARPGSVAPKKREASLHLGLATPHGTFGNLFSGGESIAIDYAVLFSSSLAVKAELALDHFDSNLVEARDLRSLSIYLQHRWKTGSWDPYFEAGVGIYDLEHAGSALGFAAGAGARRALAPHWGLDLNLQSHRVGGSLNLSFSRARVGLLYTF